MAYEPMTIDKVLAKLKDGGYDSPAAARRAVGKLKGVNDAGKAKVQAAIDSYFDVEPAGKAAPKAAKAPKAPKVKATARPAKSPKARKAAREILSVPQVAMMPDARADAALENYAILSKMSLAKDSVTTIVQAIEALKTAKSMNNAIDVGDAPSIAAATIRAILMEIKGTLMPPEPEFADTPEEEPAQESEDEAPLHADGSN